MPETIEELKTRIQALEGQLSELQQERRRYLADRAVVAILSDGDNKKFTRERFASITGVDFQGNRFVLCGFTDTFSEPGTMDALPVWESLNSTFYCRLADLIRPQFKRQHACVTANFNGCIYCLVNLSDQLPSTDYRKAFTDMCSNVNKVLEQAEGFRFQIFVSPIGYGLSQLPQLRKNIEMLWDYWSIVGASLPEILFYHDVAHISEAEQRIVASREANEQFSDYINRGDFDQAKHYFREQIMADLLHTLPSATMLRFRVAALIDYTTQTLARASRELGIGQVLEQLHAETLLLSAQTLDEISAQMDVILDALAAQWAGDGTPNQQLARQARAYVDENYGDQNLNVNQVALHLGVSPSHLTRVFHSCYQTRMLDYIQQVRIRAAKALLGGNLTIREIAEQVGYGAQINMIRAFKRLEGKTPSEFLRERR